MREIKFRGKNKKTGAWVYGSPFFVEYDDVKAACICVGVEHSPSTGFVSPDNIFFVEVLPETVGQYAGLKDKNGKDIYEGDIVRMHQFLFDGAEVENELVGVVEYLEAEFGLAKVRSSWFTEYTGYLPGEGSTPLSHFCGLHEESFEVIGNQYENPELLKQ